MTTDSPYFFTSGPWNVQNTAPSNALDIAVIFDGQSHVVCSVPKGSSNKPQQERRANARLLAAAPDLFEALQKLLSHGTFTDYPNTSEWHAVRDARAAIAKAIGGRS